MAPTVPSIQTAFLDGCQSFNKQELILRLLDRLAECGVLAIDQMPLIADAILKREALDLNQAYTG